MDGRVNGAGRDQNMGTLSWRCGSGEDRPPLGTVCFMKSVSVAALL